MSTKIEVHVDHVRGIVAIAWPDRPGYWFIDSHRLDARNDGRIPATPSYTLPAGMTQLVEDEETAEAAAAAANGAAQVPRVRAPRRYHPVAEGA